MSEAFFSRRTVVLITGASAAIGRATATILAEKLGPGSLLILSSRSQQRLKKIKETSFNSNVGLAIKLLQWDLSKPSNEQYKKDIIDSCLKDTGLLPSSFEQAIVIHNAAALGDMMKKVSEMEEVEPLTHQLNVNLVSTIVLNSVFLDVFYQVPHKTVVNMTAPSAVEPRPSFGMPSMVKSSRQIVLSILAKEEPSVRVLHFDPIAVDSHSLQTIRDSAHDPEIRAWIKGFYDRNEVLKEDEVAAVLVRFLQEDTFESGQVYNALHFTKA